MIIIQEKLGKYKEHYNTVELNRNSADIMENGESLYFY